MKLITLSCRAGTTTKKMAKMMPVSSRQVTTRHTGRWAAFCRGPYFFPHSRCQPTSMGRRKTLPRKAMQPPSRKGRSRVIKTENTWATCPG